MKLKLDMHVHSEASPDGRMSLGEIADAALRRGLDGVAICDHDHVYRGPAVFNGVLIIPGVEFSTDRGHLLGWFVSRPSAEKELGAAIDSIRADGGMAVMAHPFEHSRDDKRLMPFTDDLDGIEIWNGRADRKIGDANERARAFAGRTGKTGFAGSDAHVAREIGNGYIEIEAEKKDAAAVRRALEEGNVTVGGMEARSIDTARSQHTKLEKTDAGFGSYIKWAAFACKCAAEDIVRKRRTCP